MINHHLTPDEIDQLLDSEADLGVSELSSATSEHLAGCPACMAELEAGRQCLESIERLPNFEPSPLFAQKVMGSVNIFVPWDVAAHDAADRLIVLATPKSPRLRLAAGGLGLTLGVALSAACVWLAGHLDAVFFFGAMVRERLRDALIQGAGTALAAVFGPRVLGNAAPALLLTLSITFVVVTLGAGLVVRTAAHSTRRGRQ
jgi:hypothetical protein